MYVNSILKPFYLKTNITKEQNWKLHKIIPPKK